MKSTQKAMQSIERSILLTQEHKHALIVQLSAMNENQIQDLLDALKQEPAILENITLQAITHAIQTNDQSFLEKLDACMHQGLKEMRRFQEQASQADDKETTDTFFH